MRFEFDRRRGCVYLWVGKQWVDTMTLLEYAGAFGCVAAEEVIARSADRI